MTEKKDEFQEEIERLEHEILRDKVKKAFAENPGNYREALEDIGFTWHDDDYPSEEDEERVAVPENDRQQLLVSYFEGKTVLSTSMLNALLEEKNSKDPNYPLIRKYFRAANPYLKTLILFGLKNDPTNLALLADFILFHEFDRNPQELIEYLTLACLLEDDLQQFSEIVQEFYYSTLQDGYNALYALRQIFDKESDKRKIIDYLINELEAQDQEDIVFRGQDSRGYAS